jgi:hypothetical protein
MSQHDVARLLERGGEGGVLITRKLEVANLFEEGWRSSWPNLCLKFSQGLQAGVAFGSGEGGVEGDYSSARVRHAFDQPGVGFSRQGE